MLENILASGGVFVTYPKASDEAAVVSAQVRVQNAGPHPARFDGVTILRDLDGREMGGTLKRPARSTREVGEFTTQIDVRQPRRRSPQAPHLGLLDVELQADRVVIDSRRERIGIGRFELGPGGIILNGRKLFRRGVNRHQEYPYIGDAFPGWAQYRDAFKIKQAGFDFIRVAHSPQSREFMDACDELGLVALNATLGWQHNPGTDEFMCNLLAAARALWRRDRNHASSLLWELSLNEADGAGVHVGAGCRRTRGVPGRPEGDRGLPSGYDVKVTARQHGGTLRLRAPPRRMQSERTVATVEP